MTAYSNRTVAAASLDGPTIGFVLQSGLLVALSATAGLHPVGWVAGVAFGLVIRGLLVRGMRRYGMPALGAANRVTVFRAVLVGGVTALVAESLVAQVPVGLLMAITVTALLLDGVDGQVARRTGTASELGARFDMEVDAFLLLVLSVYLAGVLGPWVLAIGAMRYAFVAAGRVLPWLRAALPPRFSRKVVAAVQGIALVGACAGVLPPAVNAAAVALALALLCWSFGRDIGWLARRERRGSRICDLSLTAFGGLSGRAGAVRSDCPI